MVLLYLPCCEHVDHLPPSYSAVMAEKELSPWNINKQQANYEAQKVTKLLQFQSDM
ncbi:hypothetical protein RO3G_09878 [Rhizopus delemar RA 99-880]|uniref:Uncharacterized protein n=1 Tax=Rhizopus delemar (strain RA 99-880 / ATCC MYA-4621 / FGSC 9543 / NRRL 43880) TaxID=246409 RepID=I1C9N8_RHIO9|nr:hypothetical protein RO3G_09878 [Rhizopus delemar RA 99-880]|eukprot:EIE85168.1 hypothetical protein RO3G_09878 [Rhizopus delemar RA 99-880]